MSIDVAVQFIISLSSAGDLYNVVTALADLQPQWEELAVSLGVPIIHYPHSVCRCLYETIRYWITRIGGSWEELELALNSDRVQRHDTAETIRRDYITGNDYTCNCMCCHYTTV